MSSFRFGKNKKNNALSSRVNTNFSTNEEYPLAVMITLLKHKSLQMWGLDESSEILTAIASLRDCILEQNDLTTNGIKLNPAEANRETSNAIFKLGQTATTFNLLCEKHGFKSPLVGLKGHEVTTELYKLAKLDREFYGSKNAFVATKELIMKKQYSDPSDSANGFASVSTQYKFANIKLYDTVILLKVLGATTPGELGNQINALLTSLEDAVTKRKSLEVKKEQCVEFISKNKETEKNLVLLKTTCAEIEDLGRKLGALETNLETIATSRNLPNGFNSDINTKDVWESLANMFEVLSHSNNNTAKDEAKYVKEDTSVKTDETTSNKN